MRSLLLGIVTFLIVLPDLAGQEWIVPDDKKGKLSTFQFDENTKKAGEKLYTTNCVSCHGTPGKANFLKLVPPPGDPATDKIQQNSDGEIFFKVSNGRGQMPSFKNALSSDEIWHVISFVRSFNSTYKQLIMPVITSSAYPGAVIKMILSYNSSDSTIILEADAVSQTGSVPVTGAEVKLLVDRTFGHMQIDDIMTTDNGGKAAFKVPGNLPGDTLGNIKVSARFINEDTFGSISKDTVLTAALITIPVSLVAERAMWNNVRKAPLWVLLTYGLGLLTALAFIGLVLMKIRDIFIIGEAVANSTDKN
jgi:hypothetical protein